MPTIVFRGVSLFYASHTERIIDGNQTLSKSEKIYFDQQIYTLDIADDLDQIVAAIEDRTMELWRDRIR
jgi:hypothetical protein